MFEHSQVPALPGPGTGSTDRPRFGRPVDPGRILRTFARYRILLAIVAIVLVAGGVGFPFWWMKPTYSSEAQLVWEPSTTGSDSVPPGPRELRTLVDSVKLPANLDRIRRESESDQSLRQLSNQLDVRFVPDSNLITIQARAATARGAARLVRTAVDVFLEHQAEIVRQRVRERRDRLQRDAAAARAELAEGQRVYDEFRRANDLVDLALGPQRAIEEAAQLRAQAELEQERARATVVSGGGGPTDHALRLAAARTELERAQGHLTPAHPRVQSLQDAVRQIESESGPRLRTRSAAPSAPVIGVRPGAYRRLAREAEERLERLGAVQGDASRLLSRVHVAQTHLQELEAELADADDAVRAATAPFRLVSPPLVPEEPERSYRKIAAIALPVGNLLVLTLVVIGFSVWRMRAHTAREVAFWVRAPVVGATVWPRGEAALDELLDELGDDAAIAQGNTLVIAANPDDAPLAEVVARALQLCRQSGDDGFAEPQPEQDEAGLWAVVLERDAARSSTSEPPSPPSSPALPGPASPGAAGDGLPAGTARALTDGPPGPLTVRVPFFPMAGFGSWQGALDDARLRRAARIADRVLVLVRSGRAAMVDLASLRGRIGREEGIAVLLVDVPPHLAHLPHRVGPHRPFWARGAIPTSRGRPRG